ncbi:hypothetical protein [Ureibacillus chungkukjangi]|uniref:Uncharacterized protein n=1 Tax=Ureibacillus chungkukjangi TaxID=1202712 RepID=A0A318TIV1_9BACL|nr:hypothetical protein [Ureibacillus chungkukjangi]PYF01765.1 hypothetical protein BJ095_1583 [Ureibacillus chungkukjangi]
MSRGRKQDLVEESLLKELARGFLEKDPLVTIIKPRPIFEYSLELYKNGKFPKKLVFDKLKLSHHRS